VAGSSHAADGSLFHAYRKISLGYGLAKTHCLFPQSYNRLTYVLSITYSWHLKFLNDWYFLQDTSVLLIGGLMMALAVEKCQLHARIALKILLLFGTRPVQ